MKRHTILVVNPGSTSTKVALSNCRELAEQETIRHGVGELHRFQSIWQQLPFRLETVRRWFRQRCDHADAVVGMGGLLKPVDGGTYRVNERMMDDARANIQGEHASNLGCVLAYELASGFGCDAFVVDPVSVDEFEPLARYSGHPLIRRRSLSHALSIHAAARRAASEMGRVLSDASYIIAHLGGGISIAAVTGGRIVDVNDAASDGPFSPERTGGLPLQQLVTLCFSGSFTEADVRQMVMGRGGLVAYLGTNSVQDVERAIQAGDALAREILEAMAYQIAKEIGAMATVLRGSVNAIVLTGGVARSPMLSHWIEERTRFIAPVMVYPGDEEMRAMAEAASRVLSGEEDAKEYDLEQHQGDTQYDSELRTAD